jgi:hypothetical protein
MSVKIHKKTIKNSYFTFNTMAFVPEEAEEGIKEHWALFTHGYTASKRDNLSWAQRLAEAGVPSVIFDLPGHYLGSFHECESFDDFKNYSHLGFIDAWHFLNESLGEKYTPETVILGGHSLGAMLSIKALELPFFKDFKRIGLGIGLGIGQHKSTHLFETSFYQKTLNIRRQLVSPCLDSEVVFPWIKQEKLDVSVSGHRIHLITGEDDVVVGKGGMEALEFLLKEKGNEVSTQEPKRLPHHEPSLAASHIFHFLKQELNL